MQIIILIWVLLCTACTNPVGAAIDAAEKHAADSSTDVATIEDAAVIAPPTAKKRVENTVSDSAVVEMLLPSPSEDAAIFVDAAAVTGGDANVDAAVLVDATVAVDAAIAMGDAGVDAYVPPPPPPDAGLASGCKAPETCMLLTGVGYTCSVPAAGFGGCLVATVDGHREADVGEVCGQNKDRVCALIDGIKICFRPCTP